MVTPFSISTDSLLRLIGKSLLLQRARKLAMTYSHTQIAQYLRCPRSYRYRYLDGWAERDCRASMIFGRCFEQALAAYFRKEDSTAVLFKEWAEHRDETLDYAKGDSWDKLLQQGIQLLHMFARDDRVRIEYPEKNLQV